MRKLIIIFLALAFSLQAQNYFGHGQTQPSTTFSDSVKVGSSTNYINLTPASVGGMLNITAGSAANWTGIKFSGAGFNSISDSWLDMNGTNAWASNGSLVAGSVTTHGNIILNSAVSDGENFSFTQKADFDADAVELAGYDYVLQAVPNANPALGYWSYTTTGGKGYGFDKALIIGDSLRVEKTAIVNGKGSFTDSLVVTKGFRNESISTLKGDVAINTKLVVNDSLRVEETSIFKGIITAAGMNSSSGISTTSNADITTSRYFVHSVAAGLTAANPGVQGDVQLSKEINEVSTVANASDAVTLPNAAAGREIFIINNGANTLEIWPASGDNLGAGVDTATTLASGSNITFVAYDGTNWEVK